MSNRRAATLVARRSPLLPGWFPGNKSGVATSLVAIPLVCAFSFLFYNNNLGNGVASNASSNSNPLLRLHGTSRNANRSNVTNFDRRIDEGIGLGTIDATIPDCARDVFVTLHKEAGGEDERACRGLIIRDDIIVTSKECSTLDFTLDFAGAGIVEANPHPVLNGKKAMASSSLGFLEAHPPYHQHFIGQNVRRTRLFLSKNSNPRANATGAPTAVLTCGDKGEPIAHNFPTNGGMIPLLELEGIVPDDVLWEDEDLPTAKALSFGRHAWWIRPIALEEEERTLRDMIEEYRGPPGSISVPDAHADFVRKVGGMMEVLDPRGHRRQRCFENYYARYRGQRPFNGRHFFDWLDFGPGKRLLEANEEGGFLRPMEDDDMCVKKFFHRHTVHYFDDAMRARHEVHLAPSGDGKELIARYRRDDGPVPPSNADDPHLYMFGLDERFYVVDDTWDRETYDVVKHTSVLAGRPALCAGKAHFGENGTVRGIDFFSGHYRPGIGSASILYQWMKDRGFNATALHWVGRMEWSTRDCLSTDWEGIKIKGYNAIALNQSCHEMTVSPTWIVKDG